MISVYLYIRYIECPPQEEHGFPSYFPLEMKYKGRESIFDYGAFSWTVGLF